MGERAEIAAQLAAAASGGVPLPQPEDLADGPPGSRWARWHFARLSHLVSTGAPLSEALADLDSSFDESDAALVRLGEKTGRVPEMLAAWTSLLSWRQKRRSAVAASVFIPALVAVAAACATVVLAWKVEPTFRTIATEAAAPLPAISSVLSISAGLLAWSPALLTLLVTLVIAAWAAPPRLAPSRRRFVERIGLRVPFLGAGHVASARWIAWESLAHGIASGAPPHVALRWGARAEGWLVLSAEIDAAAVALEAGPAAAIPQGRVFDSASRRALMLVLAQPDPVPALARMALRERRSARRATMRFASVVGPAALLAVGLWAAFVAIAGYAILFWSPSAVP